MAKKKHSHVLRGIAPACSGILAAGLNGLLILSTKVRLKQEPTLAPLKDGTRALCWFTSNCWGWVVGDKKPGTFFFFLALQQKPPIRLNHTPVLTTGTTARTSTRSGLIARIRPVGAFMPMLSKIVSLNGPSSNFPPSGDCSMSCRINWVLRILCIFNLRELLGKCWFSYLAKVSLGGPIHLSRMLVYLPSLCNKLSTQRYLP